MPLLPLRVSETTPRWEPLGKTRTQIVLRAFLERYYSENGYTGYRGSALPDGTRYGGELGERWCSEYYSYVIDKHLKGVGHRSNVSKVISYFKGKGGFIKITDPLGYARSYRPGDYMAMDTNDDGKKNHSALFLAYDVANDRIWTVDGNTTGGGRLAGNESAVRLRKPEVVHGWGRIRYNMLP